MMTTSTHNYHCGDVVLVPFPYTDLINVKLRPAIVITADNLATDLPEIIILAEISSRMKRAGYPCRVKLDRANVSATITGLREDSVVMVDNLVTVQRNLIIKRIGCLPSPQIIELQLALQITLGLPTLKRL